MRRLLERRANPNIRNPIGTTPLLQALSHGWLEVAQLLLGYGANIEERNWEGRTLFQLAASKGHNEMMELLFEHGDVLQL